MLISFSAQIADHDHASVMAMRSFQGVNDGLFVSATADATASAILADMKGSSESACLQRQSSRAPGTVSRVYRSRIPPHELAALKALVDQRPELRSSWREDSARSPLQMSEATSQDPTLPPLRSDRSDAVRVVPVSTRIRDDNSQSEPPIPSVVDDSLTSPRASVTITGAGRAQGSLAATPLHHSAETDVDMRAPNRTVRLEVEAADRGSNAVPCSPSPLGSVPSDFSGARELD